MSFVRRLVLPLLLATGALTTSSFAMADAPPAASTPAPGNDTVMLRNGGMYRGLLTELVPGDHVALQLATGERKVIPWSEIERVLADGKSLAVAAPATPTPTPGQPAPPAPAPATPTPSELPPPASPAPKPLWRPNQTLLTAGGFTFLAGYAPAATVGLPSTISLAGRVVIFVGTLGLALILCGLGNSNSDDWLCNTEHGGMQLIVPIIGPFWYAADHPHDRILNKRGTKHEDLTNVLLLTSGGVQVVGFGLVIASLIAGKEELVEQTPKSARRSWYVLPQGDGSMVGLTFGLRNW